MNKALIFKEGEPVIVTAEEVNSGKYPPSEYEFVDPEYEYKLQFVRAAKNDGRPYFRMYYSRDDYKILHPNKPDRRHIVKKMRHYQECVWHKKWEKDVSSFCEIEKYFHNPDTQKYKRADAYYPKFKICIEFQHSYIAWDFEERNQFYSTLGIPVIWLYDLPTAHVCERKDGYLEILEDNAKGFFRISENPENLIKYPVFIQVKSGIIYRVEGLKRLDIAKEAKSTIRYFKPTETYTPESFIEALQSNTIKPPAVQPYPLSIPCLWRNNFSSMYIQNTKNNKILMINKDGKGNIFRNANGCIVHHYGKYNKYNQLVPIREHQYPLSKKEEQSRNWKLLKYRTI